MKRKTGLKLKQNATKKTQEVPLLEEKKTLQSLELYPGFWSAIGACGMYFYTCFTGLTGGDSGELLAESCLNGVAHPPGYPLFILLTQLWTKLFYYFSSDFAYAHVANLGNAVWGALAAACITQSVHMITSRRFPFESIVSGLFFAFSRLTWEYSIGAEVSRKHI
jgi:hypothetical protein